METGSPTVRASKVFFNSFLESFLYFILRLLRCLSFSKRKRRYEDNGHVSKEARWAEEVRGKKTFLHILFSKLNLCFIPGMDR